jgi:uncharacterized protein
MLGRLYSDENGENPDFEEAIKWYDMAAEEGASLADVEIVNVYIRGKGVSINSNKLERLMTRLKKEESSGNATSAFLLGNIYQFGVGVGINTETAMEWYQVAGIRDYRVNYKVNKGLDYYFYCVGQLYQDGIKIKRNLSSAKANYRESLRLGYEPAREMLQIMS